MRRKKIYRRVLLSLFLVSIAAIIYLVIYSLEKNIPDEIKIVVDREERFSFNMPLKANIETEDIGVISVNNSKIPSNKIDIDLNEPFTLQSTKTGQYNINLKLFGIFNYKKISLDVIETVELIPCGTPIGISVETDGILVLGNSEITGADGLNYSPSYNKLKSGDYILSINNRKVMYKEDFIEEIQKSNGRDIRLQIRRNGEISNIIITPVKTADGDYKIGTWIRDDTQGIGTLTFISTNGHFGALGHGITDIDTGRLMEIDNGTIYDAQIMFIVKGKEGEPGELIGIIRQNEKNKIGEITDNTSQGIFGKVNHKYKLKEEFKPLKIGFKQDVKLGKAYIRCMVDGKIVDYEINIQKIDMSNSNQSKGLVIKITDERLLNLTGGIVQGMSGSPIIQNNKIIGAVTHVFIQDSTKGYGTFIENMVNKLE
ncbi:MAG: SpoIVB peptidase [Clostridiales bacterium]|jgi:stage IV sporulation protein B|nr:SpoIVB peptidase [Clostridiales bacterium]